MTEDKYIEKYIKQVNMILWDDYGESSLTLLAVHCRMNKKNHQTPVDPSDFKRCVHLFECLEFGKGEILTLLSQTSDKYPEWKPFAHEWDNLMVIYNREKDNKSAPELYKVMNEISNKNG